MHIELNSLCCLREAAKKLFSFNGSAVKGGGVKAVPLGGKTFPEGQSYDCN